MVKGVLFRLQKVSEDHIHLKNTHHTPPSETIHPDRSVDRKSTRLNSSHSGEARMPSSA